ncbi:MAG: hypothetical protein U9N41_02615 [Euryarchaeota archaeon]|nr:hypothetical protein [Euryarchaeota archaeon]
MIRINTVKLREKMISDNRTQINADNQDFRYKELTEEIIKRKVFDNLRKWFSA